MNTMLATDGLGQTEASTQDLHPGLPQEWQEPKSLSLYLLLPRHVNRSEWEQRQDSLPGTLRRGAGISGFRGRNHTTTPAYLEKCQQ